MKFGLRIPSVKKRFVARTSPKRFLRHSLGLKAPGGFGWFTNPRKALYNRVYNRTTFSVDSLFKSGGSRSHARHSGSKEAWGNGALHPGAPASGGTTGCAVVLAVIVGLGALGALAEAIGGPGALCLAFVIAVGAIFVSRQNAAARTREVEAVRQQQLAAQAYEAQRWEAWRAERRAVLTARFGADPAERILQGNIWLGATREMVVEALGAPAAVEEKQLKTKRKTILKYQQTGANRFAFRVTLDDDVVVRWDGMLSNR